MIKLEEKFREAFCLSFFPERSKGFSLDHNKYFSDFNVPRKLWSKAALKALQTYFDLAEQVDEENVFILQMLKEFWREIKS